MFCRNCGTELADSLKFCTKCGAATDSSSPVSHASGNIQQSNAPSAQPAPKKKNKKTILIAVAAVVVLIAGALFLFGKGDPNISLVQNGHLGEFTDMTVKELFDGYYCSIGYDEGVWNAGKTDDGRILVQIDYTDSDELWEDVAIQFTVQDEKFFKVSAYADPELTTHTLDELCASLNYVYCYTYTITHSELEADEEGQIALVERLDKIPGNIVQYGAGMDTAAKREELFSAFQDTPSDNSAAWLIDAYEYLDLRDYFTGTLYDDILDAYTMAITEGWDWSQMENAGVNQLCSYSSSTQDIGYVYMDINNDGSPELLVGETENGDYGVFLSMYTIVDGNSRCVIESTDFDTCSLTINNEIQRNSAVDLTENTCEIFSLNGQGELAFQIGVRRAYDMRSGNEYWLCSNDGNAYWEIGFDDYIEITNTYNEACTIYYTPLSDR